jgi:hypothetical protein
VLFRSIDVNGYYQLTGQGVINGPGITDVDQVTSYADVQPFSYCHLIDADPRGFMKPFFELGCATYAGTTNDSIDGTVPSAWKTGVSYGDQIVVK